MSTSAAPRFKAALFTVCQGLYAAPVQVAYGHPGMTQEDDIVSIGATTSVQEVATYSTNRSREEMVTCDVTISCFRGGGPEMEQVCEERAYALLGQLEDYLRLTDITLGGVVRWCMVSSIDCDGATDPDVLSLGRCIDLTATITAHVRI